MDQEVYGKSLYYLLNFTVNQKCSKKLNLNKRKSGKYQRTESTLFFLYAATLQLTSEVF